MVPVASWFQSPRRVTGLVRSLRLLQRQGSPQRMATDLKLISDLQFAVLPRPQQCPRLLQIRFIERLGSAAHATPTTGGLETCVHPLTQYVTLKLASLDVAPNAIYRYFSDRSALEAALANEAARQLELALRKAANGCEPVTTIREMSSAYIKVARDNRHLYEVMMSLHAPEHDANLPPKPLDVHRRAGATNSWLMPRAYGRPSFSAEKLGMF